jgi:peptidoglycan/xylan/chitin deacetylase (PgdA/CDA1 family)
VLKKLKERQLKATFFVLGSRILAKPDILRKIHADGHQIALHSWSHDGFATASVDEVITEMVWNIKAVQQALENPKFAPRYARAPLGQMTPEMQKAFAAMNLEIIKWSKDTNDVLFLKLTIVEIQTRSRCLP